MPRAVLLIVDVQERLFTAMDPDRRDDVIRNIKTLTLAARRLRVPIVLTEQYPKGLGGTLPELRTLVSDVPAMEKTAFSCCGATGFLERLTTLDADHVIVVGFESHVCVLLTALDLRARFLRVTMVADAACSRRRANHDLALDQARQAGVIVSSTETVVFELLGAADTDEFREISKLLR